MREIKFRIAYKSPNADEPNKWMISEPFKLQQVLFDHDLQIDFTDGGYLMINELDDGESENIFRQYTGLLDKNGKEIYEGDILGREDYKHEVARSGWDFVFAVETLNGGCFKGFTYPGKNHYLTIEAAMSLERSPYVEVIGNIYENPELLNKQS